MMDNFKVKPLKFKKNENDIYEININIKKSVKIKIIAKSYVDTDGSTKWRFVVFDNSKDFDIGIYKHEKTDSSFQYIKNGFNDIYIIEDYINTFYIPAMKKYIESIMSDMNNYIEWRNENDS